MSKQEPRNGDTYTFPEFSKAHRISRSMLYKLIKQGLGPRIMKVGRRRLISIEAAAEWRQRMERQ